MTREEAERVAEKLVTVEEATLEERKAVRRYFTRDLPESWWTTSIAGRDRFESYEKVAVDRVAAERRDAIVRALVGE